jgi:cell division transport system permease protein
MVSMSNIRYFFKESLQGFTRNLSTTIGSIITIFLSLLIIGLFLVGGALINNLLASVENEVTITCYVADDAEQSDINKVMSDIRGMGDVKEVSFTTKEEALENFSNSMTSNPDIIEQLDGTNPLPASIDVELNDPQQVVSVAGQIADNSTFKKICDEPDDPSSSVIYGQGTVERLFQVVNYARYIGVALIVLMIVIALIFINNTIRLAILARRKEIAIMRLVGASNGFIRGPFLMEGALHAIIGSLLAVGVLQALRTLALPQLQNAVKFLDFTLAGRYYVLIYVALVVAGLIIGLIGSTVAMRRYLKV